MTSKILLGIKEVSTNSMKVLQKEGTISSKSALMC